MKKALTRVCAISALAVSIAFAASGTADAESKLPQPDPAGSILEDRLSEISDNGAYFAQRPYTEGASYAVGHIYGPGICTGSVINTSKKNLVITAAHCVASMKEGKYWEVTEDTKNLVAKKKVEFLPAFDGTKGGRDPARMPLGQWFVKAIHLLPSSSNSYVDVALLELHSNDKGQQIQDAIGGGYDIHAPIKATDRIQASLVGYPGPAPFNASLQSVCIGDYTYHEGKGNGEISRVDDQEECWVGGGASGGPYLTHGKTSDSPKQVLTVLNSNGGGNVPVVIDELLKQAGATRN